MHRMQPAAVAAALVLASSNAFAGIVATYDVGTGTSTSTIQVDFSNGNGYVINLSWTEPMNGFQAMQAVAAAIPGSQLQYDVYPFGTFLTGIGLGADYEYGNGDLWPVENYWHYWTKVGGQWEMAMFGASDRTLTNGSRDAWVFGSSALPQAVPAPGAIGVACIACFTWGARRRRASSLRS
jgi:hypothetical protein